MTPPRKQRCDSLAERHKIGRLMGVRRREPSNDPLPMQCHANDKYMLFTVSTLHWIIQLLQKKKIEFVLLAQCTKDGMG